MDFKGKGAIALVVKDEMIERLFKKMDDFVDAVHQEQITRIEEDRKIREETIPTAIARQVQICSQIKKRDWLILFLASGGGCAAGLKGIDFLSKLLF